MMVPVLSGVALEELTLDYPELARQEAPDVVLVGNFRYPLDSRWESNWMLVVSYQGTYYGADYRRALTETADAGYGPFEGEAPKWFEVEPYDYVEVRYRKK